MTYSGSRKGSIFSYGLPRFGPNVQTFDPDNPRMGISLHFNGRFPGEPGLATLEWVSSILNGLEVG